MLIALAYFSGDVKQAQNLLRFVGQLGGVSNHDALLVADSETPWNEARDCHRLAKACFKSVHSITNGQHVEGWIPGSCSLFKTAAVWCAGKPFAFIEPDACPLRSTWLDELEAAYAVCGKPFMGALIHHQQPGWPNPYLEGCAVYPSNAWEIMEKTWLPHVSWTRACAPVVVPQSVNTPLIHHVYGQVREAPTFSDVRIGKAHSLADIRPGACLFHRCKDGSLIRLLRKKLNLLTNTEQLVVVLPFCKRDQMAMLGGLQWMAELGGRKERTVMLHYDLGTDRQMVQNIAAAAKVAFGKVVMSSYPTPTPPNTGWPAACNFSFRRACSIMDHNFDQSWLWFEADCVAVKPDWLEAIEDEYFEAGKPFMGSVIGGMGHINGTAVYPPNAVQYAPSILTCNTAWDVAIAKEIIPEFTHPSRTIQHCRVLENCRCHDAHGGPPRFTSMDDLAAIHETTCMFHPSKDGSLIRFLRLRKRNPQLQPA